MIPRPETTSRSDRPLIESPALAPIEHEAAVDPLPEDIETVAARRARERARNRRFGWPLPALPSAILALILLDLGLIGWRSEIVRVVPQTASLYAAVGLPVNLRGLALVDVTTETVTNEGVPVLLIQGRIVSTAKRTVEVPRLRFAIRNAQRDRDLQLDGVADTQPAVAGRDRGVPIAAGLAAARDTRRAGAILQPSRPRRRHPVRMNWPES